MKCPKCGHETVDEKYFQKVFEYLTQAFPHLSVMNLTPIHMWREKGYDIDSQVKPAIDAAKKTGKQIGINYITKILENKPEMAPAAAPKRVATDAEKAQLIAFKKRMGVVNTRDEEWLAIYEAAHGKVIG